MAHESGHMAGGHLAQGTRKIKKWHSWGTIVSAVLGAAMACGRAAESGYGGDECRAAGCTAQLPFFQSKQENLPIQASA